MGHMQKASTSRRNARTGTPLGADGTGANESVGSGVSVPVTSPTVSSAEGEDVDVPAEVRLLAEALTALGAVGAADYYEDGYDRPTPMAFAEACRLMLGAYGIQVQPSVGAIGDGGLSVQWGGQDRYVRLLVPPDPSGAYLYSKRLDERVVTQATPTGLRERLLWLVQA